MKKLLVAMCLLACNTVLAADGVAKLYMSEFQAGYDLERTGDKITGHIFGFGNGGIQVQLEKVGQIWKGHLGMHMINSKAPVVKDNKTQFSMVVLPSGFHNYTTQFTQKGDFRLNGSSNTGLLSADLKADGSYLSSGSQLFSTSLKRVSDGVYSGSSYIYHTTRIYTAYTTLNATGTLSPNTVKNDPLLFAILYVVPFNLN